jgi:hypothetical protein
VCEVDCKTAEITAMYLGEDSGEEIWASHPEAVFVAGANARANVLLIEVTWARSRLILYPWRVGFRRRRVDHGFVDSETSLKGLLSRW